MKNFRIIATYMNRTIDFLIEAESIGYALKDGEVLAKLQFEKVNRPVCYVDYWKITVKEM